MGLLTGRNMKERTESSLTRIRKATEMEKGSVFSSEKKGKTKKVMDLLDGRK